VLCDWPGSRRDEPATPGKHARNCSAPSKASADGAVQRDRCNRFEQTYSPAALTGRGGRLRNAGTFPAKALTAAFESASAGLGDRARAGWAA
jgi:hypothetical protein